MMLEAAKSAALSKDGIRSFAKTLDVPSAKKALAIALDEAGAHAATVLAFALVLAGEKLDPKVVRALVPELDELDHLGVLMRAADADFVDLIVETLGDSLTTSRGTYLVLLAADALGDRKAPGALLTKGRFLARHDLDVTPSVCLGVAAQILKDDDLSLLASPFVKESKRYAKRADELLAASKRSALDVLPDVAAPRVTARVTVKKSVEPGRNDACPCGSGQKYKKCCALKPKTASVSDDVDPTSLRPEQVMTLRPSEIARVDLDKLTDKALVNAARRAARVGKWAVVMKTLEAAGKRSTLAEDLDDMHFEALQAALDDGAVEAAEKILASAKEARLADDARVELALIRKDSNVLDLLEKAMHVALEREGDGAQMIEIAYAMLKHRPALGILLARGAIHERRPADSMQLMEEIEDARDRLLLPPFEAWWDVYDYMMKGVKKPAAARKKDDGKDLKSELRRARAASRKASTEIDKLKKRLEEVDAQIAQAPKKKTSALVTETKPVVVDEALAEERRRLKNKVEEMQRIIGEGQEERRELKKQLAEAAAAGPVSTEPAREEEEVDEDDEGEDAEAPRGVLVPAFTERAGKALADLDAPVADVVLTVISGLAAARDNAWFGVKRLEKARTVYSARAGIHYRVLFMIEDGVLRVYEIFHRRDLEAAVNRMMKLSNPRS